MVDGLLTAWAEQESRSLSVPNLTNFNEPTSYPFPIILDHVSTPEIDSTVPLAADFSSYTSHDFDVLFGDFDQTQQSIEYGNDAIHDNWTVPNPPDDILITADALHLEDEFWGSNAAQLDTIEQADTSYAFSEKEEPLVHDIFEFRGNTESATSSGLGHIDSRQSTLSLPSKTLDQEPCQTPVQLSPVQKSTSLNRLSILDCSVSSKNAYRSQTHPMHQHHVSASSRKRQRVQQLDHVSKQMS